jgi:hypothetical protein
MLYKKLVVDCILTISSDVQARQPFWAPEPIAQRAVARLPMKLPVAAIMLGWVGISTIVLCVDFQHNPQNFNFCLLAKSIWLFRNIKETCYFGLYPHPVTTEKPNFKFISTLNSSFSIFIYITHPILNGLERGSNVRILPNTYRCNQTRFIEQISVELHFYG